MANVFISEDGAGIKDGSSEANAISYALSGTSLWLTTLGGGRVYMIGDFTSKVGIKASGNSPTDRLIVDCATYNATFRESTQAQLFTTNAKSYIEIIGGSFYPVAVNTSAVDIFKCANDLYFHDALVISEGKAIRIYCDNDYDIDSIRIENCEIYSNANPDKSYNGGTIDAITFAMTTTLGHTTKFSNCSVVNNKIYYAKIVALYGNVENQIRQDGRRGVGWNIDGNEIYDTYSNGIQFSFTGLTPKSYIRNNQLYRIGINGSGGLTNAIQCNNNYSLIIENNAVIDTKNPGGTGDGNGIIVDWDGTTNSEYSYGTIVRGNYCSGSLSTDTCAGINIWGGIATQVYGNVCTNNKIGISLNDAISSRLFTFVSATAANPCVITYSIAEKGEILTGDSVVISSNTGSSPDDINGTWIATRLSDTTFSIAADTTSSAGTGTVIDGVNRGTGNVFYNNTLASNVLAGGKTKFGSQASIWNNNIFTGSPTGLESDIQYRAVIATESHNCFFDNIVNFDYNGISQSLSTAITSDPLLDSNYVPDKESPCYHAGKTIRFNLKDYKGHKFNNPPTIGAYEFTSRSLVKNRDPSNRNTRD